MLRPRFSLRTLFVFVTLFCAVLAYQVNWIRARHKVLETSGTSIFMFGGDASAPWTIRLFERGISEITVDPDIAADPDKVRELKKLFPEAGISTPVDGQPVIQARQLLKVREI